jgi:hypothetical protein
MLAGNPMRFLWGIQLIIEVMAVVPEDNKLSPVMDAELLDNDADIIVGSTLGNAQISSYLLIGCVACHKKSENLRFLPGEFQEDLDGRHGTPRKFRQR